MMNRNSTHVTLISPTNDIRTDKKNSTLAKIKTMSKTAKSNSKTATNKHDVKPARNFKVKINGKIPKNDV